MHLNKRLALEKIQTEVKELFGMDLSIEQIKAIAESQFKSAAKNMADFIPSQIPYVGKFYTKATYIEIMDRKKELRDQGLSGKELQTAMNEEAPKIIRKFKQTNGKGKLARIMNFKR